MWFLKDWADNCVCLHVNHLEWRDDCIIINSSHFKGDQEGVNRNKPWHIYSNLFSTEFFLCLILIIMCVGVSFFDEG